MDIYIRPHKKTTVTKERLIRLTDIAEISAPSPIQRQVEQVIVFRIPENEKANYIISIIQIIKAILAEFPNVTISNEGAENVVLQFLPEEWKGNKVWEIIKVATVALILFIGSAVAIMTYHEDVALIKVFSSIQEMLLGVQTENPYWLSIPYSLGISFGIVVFYNQFGTRKLTDDPTPIQVEMSKYDADIDSCLVDTAYRSPMKGNRNNDQ